jgi:hypothetical protein
MASTVLHLTREVGGKPSGCLGAFRSARALTRWYDAGATLTAFRRGGVVGASYYPAYEIAAIVADQLVAHRFTSVVDGVGLWSFVALGRKTRVEFDHIADGNTGSEIPFRTFHWQGLLENLAAFVEKRTMPFENGKYTGKRPRSARFATFQEVLDAARAKQA